MVVGNGLLAQEFKDFQSNDSVLIFASGVSNSLEQDFRPFEREKELVLETLQQHRDKLFVYFSTCSLYDETVKNRPYTIHKVTTEELIRQHAPEYLICRLSNIVGKGGNTNTIFNYLVNAVKTGSPLTLWKNATRNLLDVEDMANVVRSVLTSGVKNTTIDVANLNSYPVGEIVQRIEHHLGAKANVRTEDLGDVVDIELGITRQHVVNLNKDMSIRYIDDMLRKYHAVT